MSYCRFSDKSDVYMYPTFDNSIVCCACRLVDDPSKDPRFFTVKAALEHLDSHSAAGHKVPACAIQRLKKELAERGPKDVRLKHRHLARQPGGPT